MSEPHRPWWLLLNKPPGLVTTISDQSRPGERVFVIRGEPIVQGLAWLVWGPVAALLVIAGLTSLAIAFNLQQQPGLLRLLFVGAYLGLPALAWGLAVIITNQRSAKYVQAIQAAETRQCTICLNQREGKLMCQPADGEPVELRYEQIERVYVSPSLGAQDSKAVNLALETTDSTLVLLNNLLGSHAQKADLALEIETALQKFTANKNPSG